ncbi:hypothetical protein [Frisingicoccus sp.]|uniref:hypothetical protein n=1 Tax=Frisingicoccus sp. TaxID=1918627 RepID=UPI003AB7C48B
MGRNQKNRGTFIVKIMGRENATWQGNVTWAEQNKVQNFRSALELMKMLDAAVRDNDGEDFI